MKREGGREREEEVMKERSSTIVSGTAEYVLGLIGDEKYLILKSQRTRAIPMQSDGMYRLHATNNNACSIQQAC